LKILLCKKYSFQKLTQFSKENNVVDGAASSIAGFLWREHMLPQISCIGLFGANRAYLLLEIPKFQEVFLLKTKSITTGK
jgi:hypothetical protein